MLKSYFRNTLLVVVLLLQTTSAIAQRDYADSLRLRVNRMQVNSTSAVDELLKLSLELVYVQPNEALNYAQKALETAQLLNYNRGVASAYRTLGSIYSSQDNYITSSDYLQRALNTFRSTNDSVGIANCYISLGHTFRRQNNREQEIYYHRNSYQIFKELDIPERLGVAAHNLGESYYNIGKLDSAIILTNLAIEINQDINKLSVLSSCYKALGKIYIAQNKLVEAEDALQQVINISEQLGDNAQKIAFIESLMLIADLMDRKNNEKQQLSYLLRANDLNSGFYFSELTSDLYDRIIAYYLNRGNADLAREYLQRSVEILDSINIKQQIDRSELMMSAIKSYQLEEETALLEGQNQLQNKLITQQKIQIGLALLLLILLSFAMAGFYRINQQLKITNIELAEKTELIEQQREELKTTNATKDKFFGIVAHDLRGPLGNVKQLLDLYFSGLVSDEKELEHIKNMLNNSVDNTYNLVVNLISWASIQMQKEESTPELFPTKPLIDDILQVYGHTAQEKGIKLFSKTNIDQFIYADRNQVHLIIRNLLNNAIKFTPNEGEVTIETYQDDDKSIITVSDSGIGISAELQESLFKTDSIARSTKGTKGEEGSGLGLILCKEYAEMNNGVLTFVSNEGKGTTFSLTLPS